MGRQIEWRLRRATPEDCPQLADCIDSAYSVYRARISELPDVSGGLVDEVSRHLVWVAEFENDIVGGIILAPQSDHLLLANVAVHPKSKGVGLGRALMELAETQCLELGLDELRLTTHIDMPENVELYRHLGWEETQRCANKVKMSKRL